MTEDRLLTLVKIQLMAGQQVIMTVYTAP